MSVKIVDWRITSLCTGQCGFCYAANELTHINVTDVNKVVDAICSTNCETVCITGGEPLIEPEFAITIMKELKKHNLDIYLSTNGTNYINYINDIEPLIAKLSLPLDGFSVKTNQVNGRLADSFDRVKNILQLYNNRSHSFPIKVATVLTKQNKTIEHFTNMYNFLKDYKIDLWEIYQFIPESRGSVNQEQYAVSDEEWCDFYRSLQPILDRDARDRCFKVFFSGRKERNAAYFIVQPDASVIIPLDDLSTSCEEKNIGNLLTDDIDNIRKEWLKQVNINNVRGLGDVRTLTQSTQKQFDEVDRTILYELDKNPLQNNDSLSKVMSTFNVNANDVGTRIDRLYQSRVIKKVIPIVNILHFKFNIYLYTLLFKAKSPLNEIINGLECDENIAWIAECYDLDKTKHQSKMVRFAVFAKSNAIAIDVTTRLMSVF
ncbi:MAG: radical SAM protein, partial [Nitrososphaerota archaeon]|nr:radical SAM protein [Nitrososphaerota archaeon]